MLTIVNILKTKKAILKNKNTLYKYQRGTNKHRGAHSMAIGAIDKIDKDIVKRYYKLKMENPDVTRMVDSQKMLETMNDYAMMQRNMLAMNEKLKTICAGASAKSAAYMKINFIPPQLRKK